MATKKEIGEFIGWLLTLHLPKTPRFESDERKRAYLDQWSEAFKNVSAAQIKDVVPYLRDTLTEYPTIPAIKKALSDCSQFRAPSTLPSETGITHYNTWGGKMVWPGFSVASIGKIAACESKSPGYSKNMPKINMKTGHWFEGNGRSSMGNASDFWVDDGKEDLPDFLKKFSSVKDLARGLAGVFEDLPGEEAPF